MADLHPKRKPLSAQRLHSIASTNALALGKAPVAPRLPGSCHAPPSLSGVSRWRTRARGGDRYIRGRRAQVARGPSSKSCRLGSREAGPERCVSPGRGADPAPRVPPAIQRYPPHDWNSSNELLPVSEQPHRRTQKCTHQGDTITCDVQHQTAQTGHVFTCWEHGEPRTTSRIERINGQISRLPRKHRDPPIDH